MSHEISFRDGVAQMASTKQEWHYSDTHHNILVPGAPIEEWITAAGMDFRIERAMVRFATAHGQTGTEYAEFPGQVVLLRSDNKAPLGIVSDKYKRVQPKEVLEFFRDLTEAAGFQLETAGVLFDGKRFWALASIGAESYVADKRDSMKRYLMLSTSADGSIATQGHYVDTRVVCNNTITAAFREGAPRVKVSHRSRFDAKQAKIDLGVDKAHEDFTAAMSEFRKLAETGLTPGKMVQQTVELLHGDVSDKNAKEMDKILRSKPVERIVALAAGSAKGSDYSGTTGTQWGWLNAVTEFVDHESRARSTDNRINSAWFGAGSNLKQKALEVASIGSDGAMTMVQVHKGWSEVDTSSDAPSGFLDDVLNATIAEGNC